MKHENTKIRSTTVLLVRRNDEIAMAGDGQVTLGETVIKGNARKVRRIYNDKVLVGFAGATADAFSLLSKFEAKLEQYQGQLERAAIELSKEWRTDKYLRHLEALLIVADKDDAFFDFRQRRMLFLPTKECFRSVRAVCSRSLRRGH